MVGSAIVVVQLNAHITQPGIQFVFLISPDFDSLRRLSAGRFGLNEVFNLIDRPLFVSGCLLRFCVDHIEEVHIKFAVTAEDVQLFNEDNVGIRIGLLGADRRCQSRRTAANDDDITGFRFTLNRFFFRSLCCHGNFFHFHAGLSHRIRNRTLHTIGRECRRRYAVNNRRVRLQDSLPDYRKSPIDDDVGLMAVYQLDIGDRLIVNRDFQIHLSAISVAGNLIHLRARTLRCLGLFARCLRGV